MLVTVLLIAITCAVSITCFSNPTLLDRLLLWPPAVNRGEYQRLVTNAFVHADGAHLAFNMITLFFFGRVMEPFFERYIGIAGFVIFYLAAAVVSVLPSYLSHRNDSRYRSLGASGAVSAVLFAFILLAPWSTIYVFVIPVPAILYGVLFTAYGLYAGRLGQDHINHSAHLWGAAFGVAFTLAMEPRLGAFFLQRLMSPGM
ncbi:rhomboid family intramembrane serine protease [Salinisphaera sp. Q1T1-3]|uniref:rhomboid family intramembrane serine protease n=1 Tax=Salinisphaera sp. Q1T1-3 TaxID=2321229 RepID=UPI000E750D79|nr:rhomboid family intramembrane serine protease [Salinisphaera sp. Q1T1-3]RJS94099.1 rhomboid family intramembrane serine protease [Salinisphaera sp. Q1T1-3]